MNKNATQAFVAILGMVGLVSATLVTLLLPDLEEARNILVGGLIAASSTSAAWLFRLNGSK